jgi:hypothetical protein
VLVVLDDAVLVDERVLLLGDEVIEVEEALELEMDELVEAILDDEDDVVLVEGVV